VSSDLIAPWPSNGPEATDFHGRAHSLGQFTVAEGRSLVGVAFWGYRLRRRYPSESHNLVPPARRVPRLKSFAFYLRRRHRFFETAWVIRSGYVTDLPPSACGGMNDLLSSWGLSSFLVAGARAA